MSDLSQPATRIGGNPWRFPEAIDSLALFGDRGVLTDRMGRLYCFSLPSGMVEYVCDEGDWAINHVSRTHCGEIMCVTKGSITIRSLNTGEVKTKFDFTGMWDLVVSPVEPVFASLHENSLSVWDHSDSLTKIIDINHSGVVCGNFSPDGSKLAIGDRQGGVRVIEIPTGRDLVEHQAGDWCRAIGYSPNGQLLACCAGDSVSIWNQEKKLILAERQDDVRALTFDPTSRFLLTGSSEILVWDVRISSLLSSTDKLVVTRLEFLDERYFVSADDGGLLRIWDLATFECLNVSMSLGQSSPIKFLSNSEIVTNGGALGNAVLVWDASSQTIIRTFQQHEWSVLSLAVDVATKTVFSGSGDGTVRRFSSNGESTVLMNHKRPITFIALSNSGKTLIVGSEDGIVRILEAATGHVPSSYKAGAGGILELTASEDGKVIATVSYKSRGPTNRAVLAVWQDGSITMRSDVRDSAKIAMFPKGNRMLSMEEGLVRLWDMPGCTESQLFKTDLDIRCIVISPDEKAIVAGGRDGTVTLWRADSGELVNRFTAHSGEVSCIAFSPDQSCMATSGADSTIALWNLT